jgi:hypothetical protein
MLEIFGKEYYIDLDRITEECRLEVNKPDENSEENIEEDTQTINIFKYEILKIFIERILSENFEDDETIGSFGSDSTTLSFKIAFNTLIKNQILIENEDE